MPPRRINISPHGEDFNRVVRLEGQIHTAIDIIRFRDQYEGVTTDTEWTLARARECYFRFVQHLQDEFLETGIDLVGGARNLGSFVRMMQRQYFGRFPDEIRGLDHHWPKILWFQKLQSILEDEKLNIEQALAEGWRWFLDPEQYPSKYYNGGIDEFASFWIDLGADQQTKLLERFAIDGAILKGFPDAIKMYDITTASVKASEAEGLEQEFRGSYNDMNLDVIHPEVKTPTSPDESECSICRETFDKGEADHRAVETICGHVFGYSCLRDWFMKDQSCPMCREDFQFSKEHMPSPEELLESCDRALRWHDPPCDFQVPSRPHSFLDKLALVFIPANEIRLQLSRQDFDSVYQMRSEWINLRQLALYLARDRMQAVLEDNVQRFGETVELQVQAWARRMWIQFLKHSHPSFY
ncbi:hypothetical protein K505DRAFT_387150 [Melanomma pulvis-pyrius CBS 109.77]|uniref:RING-type domain-containing protein n=1 Tax=Melanomma pulvis-pyrius CBS 109.77 TaxID=1314802 RepID=A0A6A6X885_9PLEO|nr:hypothetical protein K505DRAFT_387150 [Melanomma pulvis-pyrius CBS 109.77]